LILQYDWTSVSSLSVVLAESNFRCSSPKHSAQNQPLFCSAFQGLFPIKKTALKPFLASFCFTTRPKITHPACSLLQIPSPTHFFHPLYNLLTSTFVIQSPTTFSSTITFCIYFSSSNNFVLHLQTYYNGQNQADCP